MSKPKNRIEASSTTPATNGELTPVTRVRNPHGVMWEDYAPTTTDVYLDEWRLELIHMLNRPIKSDDIWR